MTGYIPFRRTASWDDLLRRVDRIIEGYEGMALMEKDGPYGRRLGEIRRIRDYIEMLKSEGV